jgi:hypothetical protein
MAGLTIALLVARSLISQCDNVALGAVATATGDAYHGCGPERAVDGVWDTDCGWGAQGLQELYIDTGDLYLIERLLVGPFSHYYYVDEWYITHSTDGVTWNDFAGVTKLRGAGDLGPTGIAISNGDPGTGDDEPLYKLYEFTVTPTELRYVRITVVVGDIDSDSNIDEIELCAAPSYPPDGGDGGGRDDGGQDDGSGGNGDPDPGSDGGGEDDGGGNGDSLPADASGGDPDIHPDSDAARCHEGQYYDLMADECKNPRELSCRASSGQLTALLAPLFIAGRRRRQSRQSAKSCRQL